MEIGPREFEERRRSINGKGFRFIRRETVQYGIRTVTLTAEEWDPMYGVWLGEYKRVWRHHLRSTSRVVSGPR